MENQDEKNNKKKLTIIIVSVVVAFLVCAFLFVGMVAAIVIFAIQNEQNYEESSGSYKIEVGATKRNFSGKYMDLFETMDENSDGILSHEEALNFYKNVVVVKENHPDIFLKEDGKWTVSKGLRDAALEYYTKGEITTPELKQKYDGYFYGINSGVK